MKVERDLCKPKHTVFVDSSDDDNKPSLKKLRYDSTKNYEDYSDKKKRSSTKEAAEIETEVIRSRSDSFKKNDKNSSRDVDQILVSSSDEISPKKKQKSNKTKREKNSSIETTEKLPRSVSRHELPSSSDEDEEPSMKKSFSESTKKSENNSDQKIGSSTKEASQIDSVMKRSKSDSTNSEENISPRADDQNGESSSEEVPQIESVKKISRATKRNETEMKCPICKELRTCVVSTLRSHLRQKHFTDLGLAGIFLICDCGHESQSDKHLQKCKIANYTLIRKKDGPIQTFHDKKVTPPCYLCEVFPRTAIGYATHILSHHNSTLKTDRKYLICSCGQKVTMNSSDPSHTKKCDGRKFTLHDVDEE